MTMTVPTVMITTVEGYCYPTNKRTVFIQKQSIQSIGHIISQIMMLISLLYMVVTIALLFVNSDNHNLCHPIYIIVILFYNTKLYIKHLARL